MLRWIFALGLIAVNAWAVDEDRVIKEMTRNSDLTTEEIRASYKDGCSSGYYRQMLICTSFGYTAADLELNELYKKILRQLTTKSAKAKLLQAQRAWITYRDKNCVFEADGYSGGHDWSIVFIGCQATATHQRISKLNEYLDCKDPGCPGEW